MNKLTYRQLAFILDVPPIEAYEKIISVHCKVNNLDPPSAEEKVKGYADSGWPTEMLIDLLSVNLNLPDLQDHVNDICSNFLKRPASKKWILCDFPEKKLKTAPKHKIKIPPVLCTFLSKEDINTIKSEWRKRFDIKL